MSSSLFLSLRADVAFSTGEQGELVLESADSRFVFKQVPPGLRAALEELAVRGAREERLTEMVLHADGPGGLARLFHYLQRLTQRGIVLRSAHHNGVRLATLMPISPSFMFAARVVAPDRRYALSRFTYLRRERDEVVLESPLSHALLTLHDWRATALVHLLAQPCLLADVRGRVPDLSDDAAAQMLTLLVGSELAGELSDAGTLAEDDHAALQCWEFHDLLFHARSRKGRHDYAVEGAFRFVGRLEPPPALKPVQASEVLELYRPDLDQLRRVDPPFAHVQETRCSVREYADRPIGARQLGEFLYRVGRVKDQVEHEMPTPHGPVRLTFAPRPYPAGGALYELELYVAVNACEGVAAGLYHYDALNHRLERISGLTPHVEQLLQGASESTGIPAENLQVLIIIAARFQRVAWKYAAMAYALILKHVGVLYQTMYLAATAMGLAACGVGCGDSDLFARAAGTNYYVETSVGEFLLGSSK